MNRFTYIILSLVVALSLTAMAQEIDKNSSPQVVTSWDKNIGPDDNYGSKNDQTQALVFRNVAYSRQSAGLQLYSDCTPFVYDPGSKYLFITGLDSYFLGSGGIDKIQGEVYYSKNLGTTWDTLNIFDEAGFGLGFPSLSVFNPNSSKVVTEMNIAIMGEYTDNSKEWKFAGGTLFSMWDGSQFVPELSDYPENNNPGNDYVWNPMKWASNSNVPYTFASCMLSVKSDPPTSQYGAYGFLGLDVSTQSVLTNAIPSDWSLDKFRDPNAKTSSYNTSIDIAVDDNGNVYGATLGMFVGDPENRVLAITKSTDNGATWSDFDKMPHSLLDQYAQGRGYAKVADHFANFQSSHVYLSSNGFIAYGEDKCSYIFPLYMASSDDTIRTADIVEAKYDNGNWSLHLIHELNNMAINFVFANSTRTGAPINLLRISQGSLGFEIQAAITADGQSLVVKFIDQGLDINKNGRVSQFSSPVACTVLDQTGTEVDININGIAIDDIYLASRRVAGTKWGVVNSTNDTNNYKGTWIPSIVPSLNQVPVICATAGVYVTAQGQIDPTNLYNQLPPALRGKALVPGCGYNFAMGQAPLTSVDDNPAELNFKLNDVYPNPVTTVETTQFTWEMNKAQNIKLELYNSIGQLIEVLYENYSLPGLQGFSKDLSKYPSGSYLYVLTTESGKLAKTLNILN